jgi:hypothetical protein
MDPFGSVKPFECFLCLALAGGEQTDLPEITAERLFGLRFTEARSFFGVVGFHEEDDMIDQFKRWLGFVVDTSKHKRIDDTNRPSAKCIVNAKERVRQGTCNQPQALIVDQQSKRLRCANDGLWMVFKSR